MAKIFAICKLCKSKKFLNSIALCKKCAKSPESANIQNKAMEASAKQLEAQAEKQGHDVEEKHELESLEKLDDLSSDQKTRLEELQAKFGATKEEATEEKPAETPKEEKKD